MKNPSFRPARGDDAQALADLSAELGYPTHATSTRQRFEAIVAKPNHRVLIAADDEDRAIGWIHVFIALRIESDPFAEIGGFVVARAHRGQGIGRQLLQRAERWAARLGVEKLRVRSRAERTDAHRFYERLGFERSKTQQVFDQQILPR